MRRSFKIALGGIICAICLVIMFAAGVITFGTISLPALAGVLLICLVIELGVKWAVLAYVVISVLAVFLTPDISASVLFVCFFGYYPIVKSPLERIKNRVLEWVGKIVILNAAIVAVLLITKYWVGLNLTASMFGRYTDALVVALWIGANAVFVLYDIALTRVIGMYFHRIHPRFAAKIR